MPRDKIILACTECKSRNYFTDKNKRKHPERVERRKYCPRCDTHRRTKSPSSHGQCAGRRSREPADRWVAPDRGFPRRRAGGDEEGHLADPPELIKATRMIIVLSIVLGITIGLLDWVLQVILVDGVARLAR